MLLFAVLAVAVWIAGTRLGRCARDIAERTHAGQAFIGTLLLGGVASLPEAAMACSAAVLGNQRLAVNVLLGGIVFSVLVLAIADLVTGVEPLSSDVKHPVILLQGAFVVLLLVVAAAAIVTGDVKVWLAGAWTTGLAALGTVLLLVIRRRQRLDPWRPEPSRVRDAGSGAEPETPARTASPPRLAVEALVSAATILCAGYLLAGRRTQSATSRSPARDSRGSSSEESRRRCPKRARRSRRRACGDTKWPSRMRSARTSSR